MLSEKKKSLLQYAYSLDKQTSIINFRARDVYAIRAASFSTVK